MFDAEFKEVLAMIAQSLAHAQVLAGIVDEQMAILKERDHEIAALRSRLENFSSYCLPAAVTDLSRESAALDQSARGELPISDQFPTIRNGEEP